MIKKHYCSDKKKRETEAHKQITIDMVLFQKFYAILETYLVCSFFCCSNIASTSFCFSICFFICSSGVGILPST